ncbi:MAG: hypothetical protein ACQEUD_20415 [Bacillota bacterium]
MLNEDIWIGIEKRKRSLNPIFLFGAGMNLGEKLNPYVRDILLNVLLEIYYRELRDDEARTKDDIYEVVREILETFKLDYKEDDAIRLGNGIFYQGDSKRMDSFKGHYYNHEKQIFEEQRFSYLEQDREYTKLKKGTVVYKLTDESIRMILMSREFEEEMDMSVEQLYTLQLIRAGRVNQAVGVLDALTLRIRRLLAKEKDYRYELERNPKVLLTNREVRKKSKEDVRTQSEEAQELYKKMLATLKMIERGNELSRLEHLELENKIFSTSKLHLSLTDEVYKNIALELDIRKNNPLALVYRKTANFHQELWEKHMYKDGIPCEDIYDLILGPLFSPKQDVILPMEWIWQEQELVHEQELIETDFKEEKEEPWHKYVHEVNWDVVVDCWYPIFKELASTGEFCAKDISSFEQWNRDAIDFWPLFAQSELSVGELHQNRKYNDERFTLLQRMLKIDGDIRFFEGKVIYGTYEPGEKIVTEDIQMSSYVLRYKRGV